jgi:hypothetical protein
MNANDYTGVIRCWERIGLTVGSIPKGRPTKLLLTHISAPRADRSESLGASESKSLPARRSPAGPHR